MAKEKTKEELQAELAALQSEKAALEEVVAGQTAELEKLGDEKSYKAPVVSHKKSKYKVLAGKCRIKVDGAFKDVDVAKASSEDLDAILAIEGQAILEKLTSKK